MPSFTHVALHLSDVPGARDFLGKYCGLSEVPRPGGSEDVVWMSEPGRERELVFVLIPGGAERAPATRDYSHLGFAVSSREEVDALAAAAEAEGCLMWPPREDPFPVGYYCGLRGPGGFVVELSFGQPLGEG